MKLTDITLFYSTDGIICIEETPCNVESYHTRLKTRSCRFNIILILFYNNTTAYSG